MSPSGALVALALPRPAAARAVVAAWEAAEAVLPLDVDAPAPELAALLAAARPTHLVDGDGRRALPGGLPVEHGVAAVVATSGTGGAPKLVELSADAIAWSATATSRSLDAGPGDRWLCCVPVHAVAGLAVVARAWHSGLPLTVFIDERGTMVGTERTAFRTYAEVTAALRRHLTDRVVEGNP